MNPNQPSLWTLVEWMIWDSLSYQRYGMMPAWYRNAVLSRRKSSNAS